MHHNLQNDSVGKQGPTRGPTTLISTRFDLLHGLTHRTCKIEKQSREHKENNIVWSN